ncbi:MAG TPA: BTAD domain-containing putative transcriptional regulator [Anaerolineales bacterium]|nr:BTAD domain-containing putative transcriptional regulator [Anaerolineales bacterium]
MKSSAARLAISLLGPFQARLDGELLQGFRTAKVRALLAYLAVESHRPWPRMLLADLLWPGLPEKEAQSNLRNAISNLRKVIGDRQKDSPFLIVSQDTLQSNQTASTWLDVQAFFELSSSASQPGAGAVHKNELDCLEQALALYRGDFMEGFSVDSAPFEEWVLLTSQHIQRRAVEAHRLLVHGFVDFAELDRAVHYARRWVELEPLDEEAHRHLMHILTTMGQRNAALAQYEAYRQRLNDELGVEPAPETIDLYDQIRSGELDHHPQIPEVLPFPQTAQMPAFLRASQPPKTEGALFVARQKELERLDGELEKAVRGQGRIIFITGDPGSGKSALLAEFVRRAINKIPDLIVAQGQCNAYTGEADPYFPFLEIIQALSGDLEAQVLGGALTHEHALRLWRFLPLVINTILEQGPDLVNLFFSGRDLQATAQSVQGISPEMLTRLRTQVAGGTQQPIRSRPQQAALFNQFAEVLCSLSHHQPIILILDDLQWIDTDSVSLLFHIGRRLSGGRILLLGAYRPEEVAMGRKGDRHPLEGVVHELQMILGDIHIDLMQSDAIGFVKSLLDSEPNQLSATFRRLLYRHTAGHPLFTIELLRGMQLRGDLYRNEQGKWVEGEQLNWEALPTRVEAVIAERIGHLHPDCQELLRIASVEGEQFTAEILAKIAGAEAQRVIQLLSQEIGKRHRLVFAQSRGQIRGQTRSQYRFRHFLYQKYLYQHLDQVEKIQLHEKTGLALEAFYLQDLVKYPEITHQLARHFYLAGMLEKAAQYYTEAGKYALQLGAHGEAVTHLRQALQLVMTFPESEKRDRQALSLHLSLGPLLTAVWGWAAPELEQHYQQAEELCLKLGDNAQLVPALWLLAVYHLGRAEHAAVDRLIDRLNSLAQKIGDPDLLCLADLQVSPLYQGRLEEVRKTLTRASMPRDVEQQRTLALQYGMSPSVVALAYLGHCLWLLGFPDQAVQRSQEAVDLAAEINVPMTTCYAVGRNIWQQAFAGEIETIPSQVGKLLQVAQQHELRSFELAAIFLMEWVKNQAGDLSVEVIDKMCRAMEEYKSLGTLLNRTTFLNLFAQACGHAGQIERGLVALDESIAVGEKTGERWFEAEAYRLKGELLLRQATALEQQAANLSRAEDCFQAARRVACQQGAKMLELRAATSLCRLWQRLGQGKKGSRILADILSQFTEGFNGLEISESNELLAELKSC